MVLANDIWDPGESQPRKLLLVNPCSVLFPYTDQGQKGNRRDALVLDKQTEPLDYLWPCRYWVREDV